MIYPFLIPIVAIIAGAVMAIGIPIARAYARRLEQTPSGADPELARRLQHMEQAIDAIAVEVERIAEGQRFTTKLLADRSAERQTAAIERGAYAQEQRP